jgi:predicted nucleic-acid-binding protein
MIEHFSIFCDLKRIDTNILITYLLNNDLVVSLAHVCMQGSEN